MTQRRNLLALLVPGVIGVVGWFAASNLTAYTLDVVTSLLILLAAAQAWNILAGFTGQFSLGTSAFIGTGAYTTALVMDRWGLGPWSALLCSGVAGGVLAVVLAPALLRLRGDYFTIGSLAAALGVQALAVNLDLVGRSAGVDVPFDQVPVNVELFRIALVAAVLGALMSVWFARSALGLRLSAVGQDQDAAVGLGISVFRLRLLAFAVSGLLTGAAGAVLALQQIHVEPTGSLGVSWTISAVLMTIVGGIGTLVGPLVGAVVIYIGITKQFPDQPILALVIQGVALILVVRFAPRGLWPLAWDLVGRVLPRLRGKTRRERGLQVGEPGVEGASAEDDGVRSA